MAEAPTATDVALAHMALDEAELRARVSALEGDVITYRNLLQEAIHVLHDVTTDRDRLRERYHDLLNERRRERDVQRHREAA